MCCCDFERNQKRWEINEALKQENARREAVVKNMYLEGDAFGGLAKALNQSFC